MTAIELLQEGFDYQALADWLEERAHSIRRTDADMKMYQRCVAALRFSSSQPEPMSAEEVRGVWIILIRDELLKARTKFPTWQRGAVVPAAVVCEEAGELIRAALQCDYEGGSMDACDKEAVQTAAMCVRFLERK